MAKTKKLIVFWKHLTMSEHIAKKAVCEGGKTYSVKQKQTEFPGNTKPEDAIQSIYKEFGKREDFWKGPMQSVMVQHGFAEIVGHKIVTRES